MLGANVTIAGQPIGPPFSPRSTPDLALWCDAKGAENLSKNAGTNLIPYSETRGNWSNFVGVGFTDNQDDPTGGTGAILLTENSSTSTHYARPAVATVANATEYRHPIMVRPFGRTGCRLNFFGGLGFDGTMAAFRLVDDGAVIASTAANASITRLAAPYDDWYLIFADATSSSTSVTCHIGLLEDDEDETSENYTGDGASGIYVFGPQLGLAAEVADYQATGAQAETINHVSQFTDLSGKGNHFVQATDVNRPRYDAAAFDGRGGIYSDGDDRVMAVTGGIGESVDDPFTLIIVLDTDEDATDPTTGSSVNCFLTSNEGASAGANTILIRQTRTDLKNIDVVGYAGGASNNNVSNRIVFTVWFDGATFTVRQNGIQISSGSANNTSVVADKFQIFRDASNQRSGVGWIGEIIRYDRALSDAEMDQVESYVYDKWLDGIKIGAGGQSLMVGHFESSGDTALRLELDAYLNPERIRWVNGATGGTALMEVNGSQCWWLTSGAPGPVFEDFYDAHAGYVPKYITWAQGEADSVGQNATKAEYKAALQAVFAHMRATWPDVEMIIQKIGRRESPGSGVPTHTQEVREVQNELIAELSYVHFGAESYDQDDHGDGLHLTTAGYQTVSRRLARRVAELEGYVVPDGTVGPVMASAVQAGNVITVTLTHDAGTDFTPTSGIEGFTVTDDGVGQTITAAVRASATTVDLTLSGTPTGTVVVYYGHGTIDRNIANLLHDNSGNALPLQADSVVAT